MLFPFSMAELQQALERLVLQNPNQIVYINSVNHKIPVYYDKDKTNTILVGDPNHKKRKHEIKLNQIDKNDALAALAKALAFNFYTRFGKNSDVLCLSISVYKHLKTEETATEKAARINNIFKDQSHLIALWTKDKENYLHNVAKKIDDWGCGMLLLSAYHGLTTSVAQFVLLGANVNQSYSGQSALYIAVVRNELPMIETLLKSTKINVNQKTLSNGASSILFSAQMGNLKVLKMILSNPLADVNIQASNGATALYISAQNGYLAVVEELLQCPEINPNLFIDDGATPLFIACQKNNSCVVDALLKHKKTNVNQARENGVTPLFVSTMIDDAVIVEKLLTCPDIKINQARKDNGATPLHMAAECGNLAAANALLNAPDIKVNCITHCGLTALHVSVINHNKEIFKALLNHPKINVNSFHKSGVSPLMSAAAKNYPELLSALIKAKAKLNHQDKNGTTALMYAAAKGNEESVKMLVEAGAYINVVDQQGNTALSYARCRRQTKVVQYLQSLKQPRRQFRH